MLRKIAAVEILSTHTALDGLARTAHRADFSHHEVRPGYLYVRSRAISSRCNDNYDEFPAAEIETSYKTFIGKPVFVNHVNENHRRHRGVVIDAALHRDHNSDGTPDTWVEVLMEVDAKNFPKLAQAILAGKVYETSMGCDVDYSICSACGNKATTPDEYCIHIPGMKGRPHTSVHARTGARTTGPIREICHGLRFFENSLLVEPPADPTAQLLGIDATGLDKTAATGARRTTAAGELPPRVKFEYRPAHTTPHRNHEITAWLPARGKTPTCQIGQFQWDPQHGAVHLIKIPDQAHRRRGLADAMWHRAHEIAAEHNLATPTTEGSIAVSPAGAGWMHDVHERTGPQPISGEQPLFDRPRRDTTRIWQPDRIDVTDPAAAAEHLRDPRYHGLGGSYSDHTPEQLRDLHQKIHDTPNHALVTQYHEHGGTGRTAARERPRLHTSEGARCPNCGQVYGANPGCAQCQRLRELRSAVDMYDDDLRGEGGHDMDWYEHTDGDIPTIHGWCKDCLRTAEIGGVSTRGEARDKPSAFAEPCPNAGSTRMWAQPSDHDMADLAADRPFARIDPTQTYTRLPAPGHVDRLLSQNSRTASYDDDYDNFDYGDEGHEDDDEYQDNIRKWDDIHPYLGEIHRGIGVHLHPEDHAIVHDRTRPTAERAAHLLQAIHRIHSRYPDEEAPRVGWHWSGSEDSAERFARRSYDPQAIKEGRPHTAVVFHAHKPGRHDINENPDQSAGAVYGYHDHGEQEVPLHEGAGVALRGISWKDMDESPEAAKRAGHHGDYEDWLGPDWEEYTHHDFGHPGHHTTATRRTAARDGEEYVRCDRGHRHWGSNGAAGMLIVHHTLNGPRILLGRRADWVQHPGTWSIPGGAVADDETPMEGAVRETREEFGRDTPPLTHVHTHEDDHGGWGYHTHIATTPTRFTPQPGDEHDRWRWFEPSQLHNIDLHPGFAASWPKLAPHVRASGSTEHTAARAVTAMPSKTHPRPEGFTSRTHEVVEEDENYPGDPYVYQRISGYHNGRHVADIDYDLENGGKRVRVHIIKSHVPGHGYASALMDDLYAAHPDAFIHHGDRTPDGAKWWQSYQDPAPHRSTGARTSAADEPMIDLYHHTTPEAARAIMADRRMTGIRGAATGRPEMRGITPAYFSDRPHGFYGSQYGPAAVHLRVPASLARLDDSYRDGEKFYWADTAALRPEHFIGHDADHQGVTGARHTAMPPKYKTPAEHPFFTDHPVSAVNVVAHWLQATDEEKAQGVRWYSDAHLVAHALAHTYANGDTGKAAGVLSAYSPRSAWAANMHNAARSLHRGTALGVGEGVSIMGLHHKAAERIMNGEHYNDVLKAPKTNAFAALIHHGGTDPDTGAPMPHVVIDRHALSVAAGKRLSEDDTKNFQSSNHDHYNHVAKTYQEAAHALTEHEGHTIAPHQVQAVTWLTRIRLNRADDLANGGGGGRGRATMQDNVIKRWREAHPELLPEGAGEDNMHLGARTAASDRDTQYQHAMGLAEHLVKQHGYDWNELDGMWNWPVDAQRAFHEDDHGPDIDFGYVNSKRSRTQHVHTTDKTASAMRQVDPAWAREQGISPEEEWHGPYEVVQAGDRFHILDNADRHATVHGAVFGWPTAESAHKSRDYIDERRAGKERARELAEKIFGGAAKALGDDGADEDTHTLRRQNDTSEELRRMFPPHDSDGTHGFHEDSGEPFYEVRHPSGWSARYHGGTGFQVHHPAVGEVAYQHLSGHDPQAFGAPKPPENLDSHQLHQELHDWVGENGPEYERAYPEIRQWRRGRHAVRRTATADDRLYLRFGNWPHDERSTNNIHGYKEDGVSVYDLHHGRPVVPGDEVGYSEDGNDTHDELQGRIDAWRRGHQTAHVVRGDMVGFGGDGEPLLRNVRHMHDWAPDRHHLEPAWDIDIARDDPGGHGWGRLGKLAYGETKAPAQVDTLRDDACDVCGNSEGWDGHYCPVCEYLAPPDIFRDPDTSVARTMADDMRGGLADAAGQTALDQGADAVPGGLNQDTGQIGPDGQPMQDPNAEPAGGETEDPGGIADGEARTLGDGEQPGQMLPETEPGAVDPAADVLTCPACGYQVPAGAPVSAVTTDPTAPASAGPVAGDVCPNCGQAVLVSAAELEGAAPPPPVPAQDPAAGPDGAVPMDTPPGETAPGNPESAGQDGQEPGQEDGQEEGQEPEPDGDDEPDQASEKDKPRSPAVKRVSTGAKGRGRPPRT